VKTILILGAGLMQIPGIRIAKSRGWRVIVADGNPDAMARDLADRFEVVDLKDKEGLLAMARRCAESSPLDGVFTAGTDFSSSVAWVAEKMGLPGMPYAVAMRATDKSLMREAFGRAGVPSPRFTAWTGEGDPSAILASGLVFPLVVKPVDNMGSRGVRRVDDEAGLADACHAALRLSRSSRVIIEQFMEGRELSLDAVVYRGQIAVCGVADRHIFFPPHFVEMGHTMPTDLDESTVREAEEIFRAGIRAIGIDNGAAKGDIKMTPGGPMIGEIAARLSGGYMSGWTFPLSSGVEVTEAAMNIAVGIPPGNLAPRYNRTCAERAFISISGIVDRMWGVEDAKRHPGVAEIFTRVGPGSEVVFPSNNVEKCGNVIAVGDTRREAVEAAERGIAALGIRLRPLTDTTTRFLFHESGHNAYPAAPPELLTEVSRMPPFRGELARAALPGAIQVEPLPGIARHELRDWHGTLLAEAVRLALLHGDGAMDTGRSHTTLVLSGLFWKAMMRGSVQGGVYLLDSARRAASQGQLMQFLAGL
jgi:biotin carboxylase